MSQMQGNSYLFKICYINKITLIKMNNITSIEFITPEVDPSGTLTRITFASGWGASIAKHRYSYGYNKGLWELAVLKNNEIDYTNSITNEDVLGYLSDSELHKHLITVASWE